MKSTGLFGKNSGRVGGVVYSNYRGEQIVRSYQPQVKNPSTKKQVEQRAKFKLVTQVAASLGKELKMSFVPTVQRETSRNAFIKQMLKKTVYSSNQASLPIEDIILTNTRQSAFSSITVTNSTVEGAMAEDFSTNAKVRAVYIGYNDGGEITFITAKEGVPVVVEALGINTFSIQNPVITGYTNIRVLVYAYAPEDNSDAVYEDYSTLGEEAVLRDALRVFSGRIRFSETYNSLVPQNV